MIRLITDWLSYRTLRRQWSYERDTGQWTRNVWVIEQGTHGYRVRRRCGPWLVRRTLYEAMQAAAEWDRAVTSTITHSARHMIPEED
ncbi:MAG: hypothetical protein FJX25_02345 [Alphaproteobacteria bacterium]|uniref:Uncharacterized protein n=1 Tax=Paracoccus angustae TaxID=1671480 RepID=A0ABV7TZU5_9RHOB|nr:hypothetical protein [Alphaproteobacteria bacterium]